MARSEIVGRGSRSMIVGHGRGRPSDYEELMGYATSGAEDVHARAPSVAYDHGMQPRVIEEHPTHPREFPIGFNSPDNTPVPGGNAVQNIEVKPQVLFRGERCTVPNSIVLNFKLADLKVGKDSQFAAPGDLATECMSNISIGVRMQLDTAEPGITITIAAKNTDPVVANSHAFSAVLYGTVVE